MTALTVQTSADQPAMDAPAVAAPPGRKLGEFLLGLALLALIFGGVGYVVWRQFGGPKQSDLTEVPPSIGQRIVAGAGLNPRRPTEVVRPRANGLAANAGDVHLEAVKPPKTKQWSVAVTYSRIDLLTPAQQNALTARFRLPIDPGFVKSLNVTPDQLQKLNAVPTGVALIMPLTDDDKAKLISLCDGYQDAKDKSPASAAIIKQLESMAPAKLAAARQDAADRADQIAKILTPEQIAAFKK